MELPNLQDLAKIVDLCRKKGIEQIKITAEGVELRLGEKPQLMKPRGKSAPKEARDEKVQVEGETTEEQALFWSTSNVGMQ